MIIDTDRHFIWLILQEVQVLLSSTEVKLRHGKLRVTVLSLRPFLTRPSFRDHGPVCVLELDVRTTRVKDSWVLVSTKDLSPDSFDGISDGIDTNKDRLVFFVRIIDLFATHVDCRRPWLPRNRTCTVFILYKASDMKQSEFPIGLAAL